MKKFASRIMLTACLVLPFAACKKQEEAPAEPAEAPPERPLTELRPLPSREYWGGGRATAAFVRRAGACRAEAAAAPFASATLGRYSVTGGAAPAGRGNGSE